MTNSPTSKPVSKGRFLQILGVAFGLAIIVGNTIGVGIMRTPGDVAALLPSLPWFIGVWIAGGIYALFGAMTLAEAATMLPRSGGMYVVVLRAMGRYPGFAIGWTDTISTCAAVAAITIAFGEYAEGLVPALQGRGSQIAIVITTVLALVQWRGIRIGDAVQQLTSLAKMVVLTGLALVCLLLPVREVAPPAVALPAALSFSSLILALQSVIYTYDGWNGMLYFGDEVKDPGRSVPRGMAGGVLLVVAIYLFLIAGFSHVLGLSGMAGQNLVAGTAAQAVFGPIGDRVVRLVILISLVSAANAILLMVQRIPCSMARDGLAPARLGDLNAGGTPSLALLFVWAATVALIATGTFGRAIAIAALYYVFQYAMAFVSIIVLRRREPDAPRPYRAWGYPVVPVLLTVIAILFMVGVYVGDRNNTLLSLVLLAVSWPVYWLVKRAGKATA
ncbi:MAG TPA: APC family permease [Gemmatimonadales bacterium]|nr:APC family permease [Gemmatimonadales bacterium]